MKRSLRHLLASPFTWGVSLVTENVTVNGTASCCLITCQTFIKIYSELDNKIATFVGHAPVPTKIDIGLGGLIV